MTGEDTELLPLYFTDERMEQLKNTFMKLQIADEVIPEDERPAFLTVFRTVVDEHSSTLSEKSRRLSGTAEKASALQGRRQVGSSASCAASSMCMPTVSTMRYVEKYQKRFENNWEIQRQKVLTQPNTAA